MTRLILPLSVCHPPAAQDYFLFCKQTMSYQKQWRQEFPKGAEYWDKISQNRFIDNIRGLVQKSDKVALDWRTGVLFFVVCFMSFIAYRLLKHWQASADERQRNF